MKRICHSGWRNVVVSFAFAMLFGFAMQANVNAQTIDTRHSALLMHNNRAVFASANDRMTQNFNYWDSLCSPQRQSAGCGSTHSAWVNYVGRSTELESVWNAIAPFDMEYDIKSNGFQIGLDLYSNSCTQFGVMFGYEDQESKMNIPPIGQEKVTADDYYFGFYGARRFNSGIDVRGSIGYGFQDYDMNGPLSTNFVPLSFDGNTLEINAEVGRRYYLNPCLSFRPVVGLDGYWNTLDAAKINAVGYNKTKFNQLFARVGSDVQWNLGRLSLNGGLYYSYDLANDDFMATVDLGGPVGMSMYGSDLGNSVLSLNAGGQYYLNQCRTLALYGGYQADFYLDRDGDPVGHYGTAGIQWRF